MFSLFASADQSLNDWRLVLLGPWGRYALLLALACAGLIVLLGYRSCRRAPWRRRLLLVGLRSLAVLAALVLFAQPGIQLRNVSRLPNRVAVLIDNSLSMGIAEDAGGPTRAERASQLLRAAGPALDQMATRHGFDFYTFSDGLAPVGRETVARGLVPHGNATRLREALEALRQRYAGEELGGVVVLSDGIDNGQFADAPLDAEARDFLASLETRVHTVLVGRPGLADVSVARLFADDFAFVHNAVRIEAEIRVSGYAGREISVSLYQDGQLLRSRTLQVIRGQSRYRVRFDFAPERIGKFAYEVATPVLPDEVIKTNNSRVFALKVIRDKVRVLQVAGHPSWDARFLRGLLKKDPNVDLISFFILRTPATDLALVADSELALIPFPTEELFEQQLRSFDLIVLQDFNYPPHRIGSYLAELRGYVEEGGALAMIGGELSFSSGGYAHSPVADVLPVELLDPGATPERLLSSDDFRLRLTPQGLRHPTTALRFGVRENEARWNSLPPLTGANLVARAKPGATVLGVHPYLRGTDGQPLPVLTVTEHGKGRSLALGTDTAWHWGFLAAGAGDDGQAFGKFWENAIRWLIKDPELRFIRIETDRAEYAAGDKVRLDIRLLDGEYQPARGAPLSFEILRGRTSTTPTPRSPELSKSARADDDGEIHVDFAPPSPAPYRIRAKAQVSGRTTTEEEVFLVVRPGLELEDADARDTLLRRLARLTSGTFQTESLALDDDYFSPPRVVKVNARREIALWNRPWLFLVATLGLGLEWWLRRRAGYP